MATRLVTDELDLNLAALASALLIIIVVVVCGGALALQAAVLAGGSIAIAMRLVELSRRRLLVLLCDVGHVDNAIQW